MTGSGLCRGRAAFSRWGRDLPGNPLHPKAIGAARAGWAERMWKLTISAALGFVPSAQPTGAAGNT